MQIDNSGGRPTRSLMCLLALAYKVHPDYPLLLIANRDEFHARPAAPLAWWGDHPDILAGRDLQEGGTWLGVHRSGRCAAVTNVREPVALRSPRSRGHLITRFLSAPGAAAAFAESVRPEAIEYGGFNLLLFDGQDLQYVANRPSFVSRAVRPGVHTLSNAQLDTPWPKTRSAGSALESWIATGLDDDQTLLAAMADPAQAADADLPATGVGVELERVLSSAFIHTPTYGTRCTSVLRLVRTGEVALRERRFDARGEVSGETSEGFFVGGASAPTAGSNSETRLGRQAPCRG